VLRTEADFAFYCIFYYNNFDREGPGGAVYLLEYFHQEVAACVIALSQRVQTEF
jgi:hypothetical protein